MSKHTPAPWTIREVTGLTIPGQRAFAIDFNEDQEQVVDCVYEEADAHLIAASPDLLEALEYAINQMPELATVPGVASAIAKARGES